ncbi:MAG TPA: type II secretion system F family protein, partial [Gemmataceae bacterium]|nr:type II secretion system F family protein [Gemmataceae bacterium]
MPEFIYEALANSGQRSQGTVTAASEREVMSVLDARGLFPVKITASRAATAGRTGGRRVKSRHMATFYAQLADL